MATARGVHTATLLPGGRVLVAGGSNDSGYLPSAEIYNPASATWVPMGSMNTARGYHTATLLPGGVLVAGALGPVGVDLASAEIFGRT